MDASGGDPLDAALFDAGPGDASITDAAATDGGTGLDASGADAGQPDAGAPGMIIDTVFVDDTFTQVHQGATFELVITGSGLEGVTDVTFADGWLFDPAGLVVTPTQVRAPMWVWGPAIPGPRDVTIAGDAGVATGPAAIRGLTLISPGPLGVLANGLSTLAIDDVAVLGGGIVVDPAWFGGTAMTVENLSYDGQGTGSIGIEVEERVDAYLTLSVSSSHFTSCGTGIPMTVNGEFALTKSTIEACDIGVQIGGAVGGPYPADVTASQLLDNTAGISVGGSLVVNDTVIADVEATPRPSRFGVLAQGYVVINGGEIRGQDAAGVVAASCAEEDTSFYFEANDLVISGGPLGIVSGGCPDVGTVRLRNTIVRDQTVASLQLHGCWIYVDLGNEAPGGNQLSVVSGFAIDDLRDDVASYDPWAVTLASGLTLNGNVYTGLIQGPASVPPDYRMVDSGAAIQF